MSRLENIMRENCYEFGIPFDHPKARELAELQIEDLDRKGCHCENIYCLGCETNGAKCPLVDWQKRNPEFANDELAQRIKALEKEIANENEQIFETTKSTKKTEIDVKHSETKAKIDAAYAKRGEEIRNWKAEAIKKIEAEYSAKTTANYDQWRAERREAGLPDHW